MKLLKSIIRFFVYYMIGYLIFNTFSQLTQLAIYKILGIQEFLEGSFIVDLKNNLLIYTLIYFMILIVYFSYNMILIRMLNKKLENVKKVGGEYEKE